MQLINQDCLDYLKQLPDNSVDLIFTDPPYALGSEIIIKENGKPEYKKAVDFMNKWDQPNGVFWEKWFIEAKRVLKHGGHCLMFGMDRQLWFNCYYANLSGFTQKQSLYWYFISNFPKASDLSKNLDKHFGAEREVGEKKKDFDKYNSANYKIGNNLEIVGRKTKEEVGYETLPNTPLAQKYNGIKYSVAPLKQTNETIMVFQKPYKTGSCLHDVLAMENGDESITCGGVDIEGNRCGVEVIKHSQDKKSMQKWKEQDGRTVKEVENPKPTFNTGRFPAQTYIDSGASKVIDLQSGILKSDSITGVTACKMGNTSTFGANNNQKLRRNDSGGASRILHRCDFELGDYDLYHYCPKVSKSERNEGLEGFEEKPVKITGDWEYSTKGKGLPSANNHPTVKPQALLSKILKLFKTPNDQILLDPFMGSGSMGISAIDTGYEYIGIELDPEYYKIAEARIKNAQNKQEKLLL
jgi:DNA modification methylase